VSSGSLALLKHSADGVPPAEQATTRQYHTQLCIYKSSR